MPSGGVAIVAKSELGLVPACGLDTRIVPHRAIGGAIDVPTLGHVALVAVYLDVADKWGSGNLALMSQVGAFLSTSALPFLVGGDFNNVPATCADLSFHQWVGSVVVAPEVGTCRSSAGAWSVIDYAIVNASLAWFVQTVYVDDSWPAGPHRPVRFLLHGDIGNKVALAFPKTVRYPTDAPFGPAPRPQSFRRADRAAWSAWSACVGGDRAEASRRLDDANTVFAKSAERHVAFATARADDDGDGRVRVEGRWGSTPQPRWQKVHVQPPPPPLDLCERRSHRALKCLEQLLSDILAAADLSDTAAASSVRDAAGVTFDWENPLPDPDVGRWLRVVRAHAACDSPDVDAARQDAAELAGAVHDAFNALIAADRRAWSDWVEQAFDDGARKAHRFLQCPEAWEPQGVKFDDGAWGGSPLDELRSASTLWAGQWDAEDATAHPAEQEWEAELAAAADREAPYEVLAPDELREVALSFPRRTGVSLDGVHVRHLALLPDEALLALATILLVVEQLGVLPSQLQRLLVFLIPKATGGRSPIMLAPALYRWWARARRPLAERWEADNDHQFFAASKGRTAIDPVYRRAARAEAAAAEGRCVVTGLWDIAKFFERIVHALLVRRAGRCGAPMRALRVCLGMYRAVRYLTISPFVAAPVRATVSVAAGCGFATTWVKVYSLEPLVEALAEISASIPPSVTSNAEIYIDDLQWDVEAASEEEAACAFVQVAHVLSDVIQIDMHADLAYDKAAVVASAPGSRRSDRLARSVRRRMGRAGGAEVVAAHNLGIDYAAGRPRAEWAAKTSTLKLKRFRKGARRAGRAAVLRRHLASVSKHKAKRLFAGNVRAVAFYGAEVHGLDDRELAAAWRLAAKCLSPTTPGRSVDALALTNLKVIGLLPFAQVRRWALEVWRASCGFDRMAIPLSELCRIHADVAARGAPQRWRDSRGPVGGAFLELKRLGWSFGDGQSAPFSLITDLGDTLVLTRVSPAALDVHLSAAYGRALERRLAAKWRAETDYGVLQSDLRLAHEPVARAINSAEAGRIGRGAARAFACNAVWTRDRLVRVGGLLLDSTCPLCETGPDTMWHRLWLCSHHEVVEHRNGLPAGLVQRALAAGPASSLYARGWMVHPADVWPRPASWEQCIEDVQFRERLSGGDFAEVADVASWCLSGDVYPDGSCQPHVLSELARASWGVARLGTDGSCTTLVSGTVPSCITQTSVAAEWCAAAVVGQLATGAVDAAQDCKAVVDEWPKPRAVRLRPASIHAGQAKTLCAHPSAAHVALRWVKGHVNEEAAVGAQAKRDARGNGLGDKEADRAMARHPQPPDWLRARVGREVGDAQAVILHAARIFPLWPKASKAELQAARPASVARVRRTIDRAHQWVCVGGRWQCRLCLAATFSDDGRRRRSKEDCPGDSAVIRRVVQERRGHLLMVADVDGGPCTFCAACGAWCTSKPRDLLLPCVGRSARSAAGLAALTRLRKGYVPDCGEWRGRRVHAVEALNGGAAALWASVPVSERSCGMLRQANADDGARRSGCCSPALQDGAHRSRSVSPPRAGTRPPLREASADRERDFLASLGSDPLDRLFAAAIARRSAARNGGGTATPQDSQPTASGRLAG
jgi:hypothetical protein